MRIIDFKRLADHKEWLNDEIINFYGQLIMARSMEAEATKENKSKVLNAHVFNTFFWPKMKSGYEKGRLAKWTKKVRFVFFQAGMLASADARASSTSSRKISS